MPALPAASTVDVGIAVKPVQVSFAMLMFMVGSLSAATLAVSRTYLPFAGLIVKKSVISEFYARAALTLSATVVAESPLVTGTERVIGEFAIPAAVTTTVALPEVPIVPVT